MLTMICAKRIRFALSLLAIASAVVGAQADDAIDFSRDIRPILSDKCFACHGPHDDSREAGFRLDQRDSAFGKAESGARPVVPGKPELSELIRRITADDIDERMPPADSNKLLTKTEIELLRKWIKSGASWKEHWSLVAPKRPELPEVKNKNWPHNPIDYFTLARLEKEGLSPSPEADRIALIRRVTFDLTGLPPTLAEVDAFLSDSSHDAFEKVVDRLLHSERYGEHMARFWLDAARYGDTHGLHLDNYREMWPYRDWVVRAFNNNLSYDQFTIEQLAGDLLPDPTLDQFVATGFSRAHVTTNEGGSIKEEVYVRNVIDRVVTVGTVFMGMTFDCTRCHNHKYDPFTMNDFYSMFAFFNSLDGNPMDGNRKDHAPVLRVPSESQQKQLAAFDQQIKAQEKKLSDPWPEIDKLQLAWEKQLLDDSEKPDAEKPSLVLGDWHTVGPFADNRRYLFRKQHGPEGKPVKLDQSFKLVTGATVKWVRRADWTDGKPHTGLPGQTAANFLYRTIKTAKAKKIRVSLGSDDAIKVYLNGKQVLAKDVARGVAADQEILDLTLKAGENHLLMKIMNYGGASGFYFATKSKQSVVSAAILKIAKLPLEKRSSQQQQS
ncbi:MAG: DUF1549 domain-containing protein, partial [Planctomycetes bacterium]|nr:DUF1549 domain-containing protein [Planctomycetota bacterium]